MPIQYHRRSAFYFAACTCFVIILLLFLKGVTARTSASGSEARWQELGEKLRDPRFLLLRAGAFDPLESEPAAVRVGQTRLETTSLSERSARLAARQTAATELAYYIVQYPDRILPARAEGLRARGYEIVGYVANNAYIVKAPRAEAGRLQAAQGRGEFRWVGAYGAGLKVESALAQTADEIANGSSAEPNAEPNAEQAIAVSLITFRGAEASSIREAIGALNLMGEPILEDRHDGRTWGVISVERADLPRLVTALAAVEGIEWIERRQPRRLRNDSGVKVVQTGQVGTDTPLYRNGLTGAGQVYGAADSGLDGDNAQFKLNGDPSAQTLSFAVTTSNPVNGLLPVNITNPNNKVLAYYLLGSGALIASSANPNGGQTLDPNQRIGSRYLNSVAYDDSDGAYHGTATTSVAAGRDFNADGTGGAPGVTARTSGDGVAPDARIVFQDVGHPSGQLSGVNFISQALIHQQAYSSGVRAHNNSYGPNPPVGYGGDAADIDDVMWRLRDYNIFFAAGNDGVGTRQVTNAAKNNVVVAATDSPTTGESVENLAGYSNHGPTLDGRIKPDIAAPGTVRAATENSGVPSSFGNSTSRTALDAAVNPAPPDNNRSLALTGGTSFSSPMVAGAALLARQYFTDGYYPGGAAGAASGFNPSNALIKAIILNSGRNMTGRNTASDGTSGASGPLPNFGQGWGRIALDDALYFTGDRRELNVLADIWNGATAGDSTRPAPNAAITTGETHAFQLTNVSTVE
ncbi:MAG: S8 family serine peptidase, partial [Blastocatellia bacterium]